MNEKCSRNFNRIFPIRYPVRILQINHYPSRTCLRRKKKKREGKKKERIIKSSAFSWNPLIGKKPLTVEICIFLGYTRCNWKLNKNRFSLVCLPNPLISDRITPLLINQWEVPLKSPRYFSQQPKIRYSSIIEFACENDSFLVFNGYCLIHEFEKMNEFKIRYTSILLFRIRSSSDQSRFSIIWKKWNNYNWETSKLCLSFTSCFMRILTCMIEFCELW